jgi:hypothetical protein
MDNQETSTPSETQNPQPSDEPFFPELTQQQIVKTFSQFFILKDMIVNRQLKKLEDDYQKTQNAEDINVHHQSSEN